MSIISLTPARCHCEAQGLQFLLLYIGLKSFLGFAWVVVISCHFWASFPNCMNLNCLFWLLPKKRLEGNFYWELHSGRNGRTDTSQKPSSLFFSGLVASTFCCVSRRFFLILANIFTPFQSSFHVSIHSQLIFNIERKVWPLDGTAVILPWPGSIFLLVLKLTCSLLSSCCL